MDFNKQTIRKMMLEQRSKLTETDRKAAERSLVKTLYQLPEFISSDYVMAYMSFKNEFPTDQLVQDILSMEKNLILPYTNHNMMITACKILSTEELSLSKLGIPEPDPDRSEIMDPKKIELVIVPGVAFDLRGNRLGFGKGYYDKFFPQTRQECKKIGLCYDFQVIPSIPAEVHDVQMDMILTETSIIEIPKA